jgi:hypothetical protein
MDSESLPWPHYDMKAPREYIFALGVISINYSRLEYAMIVMLAAITRTSLMFAGQLFPVVTNEARLSLMRKMLPADWPPALLDRADFFIRAAKTSVDNRNLLMHSDIRQQASGEVVLSKPQKSGDIILCPITETQLRRVADDMSELANFGHLLGGHIMFKFNGGTLRTALPGTPPPPIRLEYR